MTITSSTISFRQSSTNSHKMSQTRNVMASPSCSRRSKLCATLVPFSLQSPSQCCSFSSRNVFVACDSNAKRCFIRQRVIGSSHTLMWLDLSRTRCFSKQSLASSLPKSSAIQPGRITEIECLIMIISCLIQILTVKLSSKWQRVRRMLTCNRSWITSTVQ